MGGDKEQRVREKNKQGHKRQMHAGHIPWASYFGANFLPLVSSSICLTAFSKVAECHSSHRYNWPKSWGSNISYSWCINAQLPCLWWFYPASQEFSQWNLSSSYLQQKRFCNPLFIIINGWLLFCLTYLPQILPEPLKQTWILVQDHFGVPKLRKYKCLRMRKKF